MSGPLPTLPAFIPATYRSHFIDEEIEAQSGEVTSPRSHNPRLCMRSWSWMQIHSYCVMIFLEYDANIEGRGGKFSSVRRISAKAGATWKDLDKWEKFIVWNILQGARRQGRELSRTDLVRMNSVVRTFEIRSRLWGCDLAPVSREGTLACWLGSKKWKLWLAIHPFVKAEVLQIIWAW